MNSIVSRQESTEALIRLKIYYLHVSIFLNVLNPRGMSDRYSTDLPHFCFVHVCFSPVTYAWSGGVQLANDPKFNSMCVTRAQFEEHGHVICQEKFDV